MHYLFIHQGESMQSKALRVATASLFMAALAACGGGGGSATPPTPTSTTLTVTGTAATGLAIPGATVTGKCKVGTGTATTLADGSYALTIIDGQLPCVLQITNPVDGIKLHTVVTGTGSTATANITPLTEMVTARVLGSEPNVYFAAFDPAVAVQKITSTTVQAAQTDIGLVLAGTVDTIALGNFISAPFKAATQGSPTTGDAQDKLLDALKLKLSSAQIGTLATALASNQTTDAIKQTVASMTGGGVSTPVAPVANPGVTQSVVTGTTVTLDASTSSAAVGKSLTYAWTLFSKPAGSSATLVAPTTAKPTFVADMAGSYVVSVVVNDGTTASSAAAITITASVANAAPVANAGVAQNVIEGSVVSLDGSASSDENSDLLTYAWTITSKPSGSSAFLVSEVSVKPTFTADLAGTYIASLVVNDGKVSSNIATVSIGVTFSKYSDNNDGTVTDSSTGLTWMRCAIGQAWAGATCIGVASTYTWDQANALIGTVSFAGNSNWRLPNIRELQTIEVLSVSSPTIDQVIFPNATISNYWTDTPFIQNSTKAWYIDFSNGIGYGASRASNFSVRMVRSGKSLGLLNIARPTNDYVDHGDGTVTHIPTGLMWQRCLVGEVLTGSVCSGTASVLTWSAALMLTSNFAGKSDWRLPTQDELVSLVDYTTVPLNPAINRLVFPITPELWNWSSTPNLKYTDFAWNVIFTDGYSTFVGGSGSGYTVRLVRRGQPPAPI